MIDFEGKEIEVLWYISDAKHLDYNTSQEFIYDKFGVELVQRCIVDSLIGYYQDCFVLTEIGEEIVMGREGQGMPRQTFGMNYTNPNDPEHKDDPTDWLAAGLIFAKALGEVLEENEGVVIELEGDMLKLMPDTTFDKVIVVNQSNQVHVTNCDQDLPNGQLIWIDNDSKQ
jgi:hypothetical protein